MLFCCSALAIRASDWWYVEVAKRWKMSPFFSWLVGVCEKRLIICLWLRVACLKLDTKLVKVMFQNPTSGKFGGRVEFSNSSLAMKDENPPILPTQTLPVWQDELYLEFHCCYTISWQNRQNQPLRRIALISGVAVFPRFVLRSLSEIVEFRISLETNFVLTSFNDILSVLRSPQFMQMC